MTNDTNTDTIDAPPRRQRRQLFSRLLRSRRQDQWGCQSMRRGVQKAKELKQRAGRLSFIAESQRQGVAIAKKLRAAYLALEAQGLC